MTVFHASDPQPSAAGGKIHPAPDFIVANAAARAALTLASTDVLKLAYQSDTGALYLLKSIGPAVWMQLADGAVVTANTAAIALKADLSYTLNDQTGTTYVPVLTDAGKLVTLSNAGAITVTFPANASVAFPVGTIIAFLQKGAGQVTFAITSDTLNQPGLTLKTRAQWSRVTAEKITSTSWVLSGDLAVV